VISLPIKENNMSKIDTTKPVETCDGDPVTLVLTDARGLYPLVGYRGNRETLTQWTAEGNLYIGSTHPALDLRNVKPKPVERVRYINIYSTGGAYGYDTRADADKNAGGLRIACRRIVVIDGQYDE
jgi:hypothetical protein